MFIKLVGVILVRTMTDLSFKAAVHKLHFTSLTSLRSNIFQMLASPFLWLGLILGFVNMLLWVLVLEDFDLSYAYPFLSISYITIIVAAKLIFKEHLDRYKIAGILFIAGGAAALFLG